MMCRASPTPISKVVAIMLSISDIANELLK